MKRSVGLCYLLLANAPWAVSSTQFISPEEQKAGPPELSAAAKQSLFVLGKTWGYLKYHHPKVVKGCFDWDAELLDVLPTIPEVTDEEAGLQKIADWTRKLIGSNSCKVPRKASKPFTIDRAWTRDPDLLGEDLIELLQFEPRFSRVGPPQEYIQQVKNIGNPRFPNEEAYEDLANPEWRYRLLALYRFWNIVEYWFPYRKLIASDWDAVLREFVPRMIHAEEPGEYVLELMALLAYTEDGHAMLRNRAEQQPPAGHLNVPAEIRFVERQPVVWRVYTDVTNQDSSVFDQLEYGDIIREIGGVPVNKLIESWAPYYGASNLGNLFAQVARVMLRGKTVSVIVTVDRDATEQVLTLKRIEPHAIRPTHDRDGDAFQLLSDDIAYLKLSSVKPGRAQGYIGSASKSKGFVIDIRNYPSEFFVFNLGDRFVLESTPFARSTIGFLTDPGLFGVTDPVELKPRRPYYDGKIAILVDETSQSQSEYTAMAYRAAPNAFVVGSQTAGADGNVSWIPLPGGHRATISGTGIYYPDGSPTQQIGIVPDIQVRPSIEGIRAGRDEVLEAAVREILGGGISDQAIKEMTRVPQAPD